MRAFFPMASSSAAAAAEIDDDVLPFQQSLDIYYGDLSSVAPPVPTPPSIVRCLLRLLPFSEQDHLLDLGCANGQLLFTVLQELADTYSLHLPFAFGIDILDHLLAEARQQLQQRQQQQLITEHTTVLFEHLDFIESTDTLWSLIVQHHITKIFVFLVPPQLKQLYSIFQRFIEQLHGHIIVYRYLDCFDAAGKHPLPLCALDKCYCVAVYGPKLDNKNSA